MVRGFRHRKRVGKRAGSPKDLQKDFEKKSQFGSVGWSQTFSQINLFEVFRKLFYTRKKGKRSEKSKAMDRADEWFSKYIRIKFSLGNGYAKCFTCGKIKRILGEMHCGHFVKRDRHSTRYHEKNCKPQCVYCNTFRDGEPRKFARNLDRMYGKGTAEQLEILGEGINKRFSETEYRAIADEYRKKFNKEKETKLWEV